MKRLTPDAAHMRYLTKEACRLRRRSEREQAREDHIRNLIAKWPAQ